MYCCQEFLGNLCDLNIYLSNPKMKIQQAKNRLKVAGYCDSETVFSADQ